MNPDRYTFRAPPCSSLYASCYHGQEVRVVDINPIAATCVMADGKRLDIPRDYLFDREGNVLDPATWRAA